MQFNDQNFKQEVEDQKSLILVDFFSDWCSPCKLMSPIIEELINDYSGKDIKIGKVDVEKNPKLAERYSIMGIPTFLFFKEGKIIDQFSGYKSKEEVVELIEKNLK